MNVKDWQKKRRAILDSRDGCECPNVDSGGVLLSADERCNKTWVRCDGVLRVRQPKLEALGPKPEAAPSESKAGT